jgi:hypothetical protein
MQDQRISTPAELDGALRARELQRRSELKKVATGRSFRAPEIVGVVCSLLAPLVELVARLEDDCRAIRNPGT